jgi:hypothetical protein
VDLNSEGGAMAKAGHHRGLTSPPTSLKVGEYVARGLAANSAKAKTEKTVASRAAPTALLIKHLVVSQADFTDGG